MSGGDVEVAMAGETRGGVEGGSGVAAVRHGATTVLSLGFGGRVKNEHAQANFG